MQCYTELTPPTAVTHALTLPFLSAKATNLIVGKSSLLQIFGTKAITAKTEQLGKEPNTQTNDGTQSRNESTSKLVLLGEYPLAGTIISLARIKILESKSGGEALLIAFKDAKLSLVEWDPESHGLSTISIHYYEAEELQACPWAPDLGDCYNFLTADPNSRCAALKFGVRHLAILPFRQSGDELIGDDYDPDMDDEMDTSLAKSKTANEDTTEESAPTPYKSSFVLPLTALDPSLTQPVHLAFLYEYREPTFGVIASSKASVPSLLAERKDVLDYTVFTLDLEQRASTKLSTVQGLPYDISRVVPLPLPVGGALLIGGNEVIHVDQSGKTHAVAVNDFAKQSSSFPMADQSELAMRLEGCVVEQISADNGDILLILNSGEFAILGFRFDGRSVSGMTIQKVSTDRGGRIMNTASSCAANMGRGRIFIGSEEGDSLLVGWNRQAKSSQISKKRSQTEAVDIDPELSLDDEDLEDEEDDLYDDDGGTAAKQAVSSVAGEGGSGEISFRTHDSLLGLGLLSDITLSNTAAGSPDTLELVASTGRRQGGALCILQKEIGAITSAQHAMPNVHSVWSILARKQQSVEDDAPGVAAASPDPEFDELLIVSKSGGSDGDATAVYTINGSELQEMMEGDFERDGGMTVDVGTLQNRTKIVQLLKSEIRSYDAELGLAQILPMEDEETGAEIQIVSASFADPYLLVLRDDSSVVIFEADENGEIEEMDRSADFQSTKWLSGCIYKTEATGDEAMGFLLGADGSLKIYQLPNLDAPVYFAEGFSYLPKTLSANYAPRRTANKATLTEILVADLGDATHKIPHLIARTAMDDLVIYQPYHFPSTDASEGFLKNLRWLKVSQPQLPKYSEDAANESEQAGKAATLRPLADVGGYSTVFQGGASPSFILKEASGLPKVLNLRGKAVNAISKHHTSTCERGFATIGIDGNLRFSQLPIGFRYSEIGWAYRKLQLQQDVNKVCYYAPKGVFALATSVIEDFTLPEDSYHHEWAKEDISFRPQAERGQVKLLHPGTWSIIDTYELEQNEVILCMEVLNLEVSENTHERKDLLAIGTAVVRGEDLATKGCAYIFEIVTVVPEPDRPETNRKLRLIVKEEVKGAVTALSEIGVQGFMLMAQGQKCMVRGLKEDGTLLPVAFMDMQCYVTVAKALKKTGMVLMGDIARGLWFTGYTEEPYKMIMFGKGRTNLEIMTAEFLPHDEQLFILIADADCNLQVLQYDPEHAKSLSGARLLHKSTFHAGHFITTMTLLPSTLSPSQISTETKDDDEMAVDKPRSTPQQVLISTQSGSFALLLPIDEQMYRRLGALQTFLTNVLDHSCGLNPRAYRAIESEGYGSRGVLDGVVLRRWNELSSQRRAEGLAKVGMEEWVVRSDLEYVGGGGLGFL